MGVLANSFWWAVHWVSYRTNRGEHEHACVCKGTGALPRRPWEKRKAALPDRDTP